MSLEKSLKNDSEVQGYLIQCVRHKLGDYQYSKESVLFELFQNADDAEQQLSDAADDPSKPGRRRARYDAASCLKAVTEHIRVLHWGRLINDPVRYGDTELQDKYRDDLVENADTQCLEVWHKSHHREMGLALKAYISV